MRSRYHHLVVTYLINRLGQRYLIHDGSPAPLVAVPGPQLQATTNWHLKKGRPGATMHVATTDGRALVVKHDDPTLAKESTGRWAPGSWRLTPVHDRSAFQYLESVSRPGWGLRLGPKEPDGAARHSVTVGALASGDPSGMWLLTDTCVADARSIHLRYPAASQVDAFYNEVTPYDTPPGTYLCAIGFSADPGGRGPAGYAGIQKRPDGSQLAIFSVWHRMLSAEIADKSAQAVPIAAHPGAEQTAFSGEGSGVSVRIPFPWPDDQSTPIRFAVRAVAEGEDTGVAAHIARGSEPWIHLGTIRRIGTGGRLLANLYSFVEDFLRNGATEGLPADIRSPYRSHRARFGNPWVDERGIQPVRSAKVTAYAPHPLEDLSVTPSAPAGFGLVVATGGGALVAPPVVGTTLEDALWQTRQAPDLPGHGGQGG